MEERGDGEREGVESKGKCRRRPHDIHLKPHLSVHEMSPPLLQAKCKHHLGNFSRGKGFTLRTDICTLNKSTINSSVTFKGTGQFLLTPIQGTYEEPLPSSVVLLSPYILPEGPRPSAKGKSQELAACRIGAEAVRHICTAPLSEHDHVHAHAFAPSPIPSLLRSDAPQTRIMGNGEGFRGLPAASTGKRKKQVSQSKRRQVTYAKLTTLDTTSYRTMNGSSSLPHNPISVQPSP